MKQTILVHIMKILSCIAVFSAIIGTCMLASCNPMKERTGADLVVYGKIFTSENNQVVEAFAVKDGKYVYVGDRTGAEAFVEKGKTKVLDYTGKGLVIPGCGNGHAHYASGFAIQSVGTMISRDDDVNKFLTEIVPAAVKKAKDTGAKAIFGCGWNMMEFPKNMPTRQQLDAICSDIPMYFADYEDSTNVFVPYYRQVNMAAAGKMTGEELDAAFRSLPQKDVFAALDYYFKNLNGGNGGRPFILAGHSQGSAMQSLVLAEYMKAHPEYLKRMIAAYVIGYSITGDYLKANPHLKFAEKADDTGVIVSWNTEGSANMGKKNVVVLPGEVSINPLNWKRDETYASEAQNLGGYIYNEKTGKLEMVPNAADAQLNLKRGVVITKTKALEAISGTTVFGPASYHNGDYALYYNNIKDNVAKRIAAYLSK